MTSDLQKTLKFAEETLLYPKDCSEAFLHVFGQLLWDQNHHENIKLLTFSPAVERLTMPQAVTKTTSTLTVSLE